MKQGDINRIIREYEKLPRKKLLEDIKKIANSKSDLDAYAKKLNAAMATMSRRPLVRLQLVIDQLIYEISLKLRKFYGKTA